MSLAMIVSDGRVCNDCRRTTVNSTAGGSTLIHAASCDILINITIGDGRGG